MASTVPYPSLGTYSMQERSPAFAGLPLATVLPEYIQRSFTQSYLGTLRQFRAWVRDTQSAATD